MAIGLHAGMGDSSGHSAAIELDDIPTPAPQLDIDNLPPPTARIDYVEEDEAILEI